MDSIGSGSLVGVTALLTTLVTVLFGGVIWLLKAQENARQKQSDIIEAAHKEERDAAAARENRLMGIIDTHNASLQEVAKSNQAVAESLKTMGQAVEHKTEVLAQQVLVTGALAEEIRNIDKIVPKEK